MTTAPTCTTCLIQYLIYIMHYNTWVITWLRMTTRSLSSHGRSSRMSFLLVAISQSFKESKISGRLFKSLGEGSPEYIVRGKYVIWCWSQGFIRLHGPYQFCLRLKLARRGKWDYFVWIGTHQMPPMFILADTLTVCFVDTWNLGVDLVSPTLPPQMQLWEAKVFYWLHPSMNIVDYLSYGDCQSMKMGIRIGVMYGFEKEMVHASMDWMMRVSMQGSAATSHIGSKEMDEPHIFPLLIYFFWCM